MHFNVIFSLQKESHWGSKVICLSSWQILNLFLEGLSERLQAKKQARLPAC